MFYNAENVGVPPNVSVRDFKCQCEGFQMSVLGISNVSVKDFKCQC